MRTLLNGHFFATKLKKGNIAHFYFPKYFNQSILAHLIIIKLKISFYIIEDLVFSNYNKKIKSKTLVNPCTINDDGKKMRLRIISPNGQAHFERQLKHSVIKFPIYISQSKFDTFDF